MSLPEPSKEQKSIISHSQENYNIIVDAVAGSGKTTTILYIGENNPDKNILVLTYNRRLKEETREKASAMKNVEVHSYHAFAVRYFNKLCYDDQGIIKFLKSKQDKSPLLNLNFNMIILDEVQDLTSEYLQLVALGLKYNNIPDAQICAFGDVRQNIYKFKKADSRYLTMLPKLLISKNKWITLPLHISFRITKQMADFTNFICQDKRTMSSIKSGPSVDYYIDNIYRKPISILKNLLKQYKPGDIFILNGSVKKSDKKTPIKQLQKSLSAAKYPVYIPTNDNTELNIEELNDRIIFSSFHQSKGLERPVVVVMGFDHKYLEIFCRNQDHTVCPNTIYVALTRAKEKLVLFHSQENHYMKFIHHDYISDHCNLMVRNFMPTNEIIKPTIEFNLPDLTKHLNENLIYDLLKDYSWKEILPGSAKIRFRSKILQDEDNRAEAVNDINRIVILLIFEYLHKEKNIDNVSFIKYIKNNIPNLGKDFREGFYSCLEKIKNDDSPDMENYTYISALFESMSTHYNNSLYQIKSFDWLKKTMVNTVLNFLRKHLKPDVEKQFRVENNRSIEISFIDRMITTNVSVIEKLPDEKIIWLIFMDNNITEEQKLQTIITKFIYGNDYKYRILNILNKEIIELDDNSQDIYSFVKKIMEVKIGLDKTLPDQEFLQENLARIQEIFSDNSEC